MNDRPTCQTCRFFAPTPQEQVTNLIPAGTGQCRKRSPQHWMREEGKLVGGYWRETYVIPVHALVPVAHWCGEHEAEPTAEPEPQPQPQPRSRNRNDR